MSKKELVKCCCYCRVSTESESQASSFKHQKEYFQELLTEEKGVKLVEIFTDEGLSATSFKNRVGFNTMIQRCGIDIKVIENKTGSIKSNNTEIAYFVSDREPEFNRIYIKNSSRIARNMGIMDLVRKLREKKVYIYFADINKNTENEGDDFLISLLSVFDENESKDKSRKVKFGAERSAKNGKIRVGYELYGYTYNKEENTLRVIPEEAEIVRLIYDLRLQGLGSRMIKNELIKRGIKTRRKVTFNENVLLRILQNPYYAGLVARNRWDCRSLYGQNSKILKPQSEWILTESDRVDQIIDKETFDKVQVLIKKATAPNISKGKYVGRSEYATKIACGKCGSNYVKNSESSYVDEKGVRVKREWYNCRIKKTKGVSACNSINVYLHQIDAIVNFFCKEGQMKKTTKNFISLINRQLEEKIANIKIDIDENRVNYLSNEIKIRESKIARILDVYSEGDISKEIFIAKKDTLNKEIEIFKKELDRSTQSEEERERKINDIKEIINTLNKIVDNCPLLIDKETFIKDYLIKIIVKDDGNLNIITKAHMLLAKVNKLIEQLE